MRISEQRTVSPILRKKDLYIEIISVTLTEQALRAPPVPPQRDSPEETETETDIDTDTEPEMELFKPNYVNR